MTVDLRALGVLSENGRIKIVSGSSIDLKFQLNTPWLARSIAGDNLLNPLTPSSVRGLVWQLEPGNINHIEAIFWLPSPLGIGAAAIILLTITGFWLKYKRLPGMVSR